MREVSPEEATQVMKSTVQGGRHPYYERVTELADKYLKLSTGEDIDSLLEQFHPREDEDMFAQRKRITKTIVGAVSGKIKGPFDKVSRSNNVTKKFVYTEGDMETQISELEDLMNGYWGDETLDDYMETRILDLSFSDPNSFIVTEMLTDANDQIRVFPFEVSSHRAVNYHYTNNSLDYLVDWNGSKKYTMYTAQFTIVMIERKDKNQKEQEKIVVPGELISNVTDASSEPMQSKMEIGSKVYEVRSISNECGEIPAIRVGYKRDEMTSGHTYVSPMHKGINRLEKIIKSDSELDLVISLHAFPQKLQYAQKCQGDVMHGKICENGYVRGEDHERCRVCNGAGFIFHQSAQSAITYEMPTQDELNAGAQVPDLDKMIVYKHPSIDIVKFENEYTRQLEDEVMKDVFISQNFERSNGSATATEVTFDMDSIYDTIYPFARKFSTIYKKQVRIAACYVGLDEGLKVVHKFPKDFKLKTISQLLAERKAAEDANAPEFMKNQIDNDIAEKILFDNPAALQKIKTKQQHIPFAGKSADQIKDIISGNRSTQENTILWIEFENIMRALEDEGYSATPPVNFYELPYAERQQMIDAKVVEFMTKKSSEAGVSTLDLGSVVSAGDAPTGNEIPVNIDAEAEAKAKLRGTVGGVQGIIAINQAVANKVMTEAAAEQMLVEVYGFATEVAQKLIEPIPQVPPTE